MTDDRRSAADDAMGTIRRGLRESPELRQGMWGTLALAFAGTSGRLVVPIVIQQAIDKGFVEGEVRVDLVARLAAIGAALVLVASVCNRAAVIRLSRQSERALYGLRVKAFRHIHALSIAHHADERRGALVARVTSDIETLSQFFTWGAIAWLL
ncbi:MAG TPA: ABC transporter transmembrane domain-containing protein, partial [Acidimicrobiales bacterium]